jgi:Fe-S cluster assembly scaffold protein SufB
MKTLTESRLYLSSELERNMHLADGVNILIFDEENILEQVTFWAWARLVYCGYFSKEDTLKKHFLIKGSENRCEIYSLLSSRGEKIKAQIYGELASSHSYLDMHIVSFVCDSGDIDLDGAVEITGWVEKVEGYLSEENIFLGTTGKVRGIPTLKVHSNDVKAAHACNMQRIPDETLYYLRSRGLPKEDATVLLLQSYIAKIFGHIRENNEDMYLELEEVILVKLR